jgi:sec-independent protein translocase protein TatC
MPSLPPSSPFDHGGMSFGDHLDELRRRLIYALLLVLPIFILSVVFGDYLVKLILHPAQAQLEAANLPGSFIVTNPVEALGAYFRVAAVVTVVVGVPAILLQLWMFVSPGLYPHERRFALFLIPFSMLLSIIGLLFLYYVMLPAMLTFLIRFGASLGEMHTAIAARPPGILETIPVLPGDLADAPVGTVWVNTDIGQLRVFMAPAEPGGKPTILGVPLVQASGISQQYRVSEYVNLVFTMALAFAIGFQTPVVVLLLGWMGIVDRPMLARKRKHAVLASFIISAVLTPSPDPFSMVLLAVPLYMLYELGLLLLRFVPASRIATGFPWKRRRGEPPDAGDA